MGRSGEVDRVAKLKDVGFEQKSISPLAGTGTLRAEHSMRHASHPRSFEDRDGRVEVEVGNRDRDGRVRGRAHSCDNWGSNPRS
jgi:hypothetical protein